MINYKVDKERLLDWAEYLGYAFNDVDLDYESEEAHDAVHGVWLDILDFCKENNIDLNEEMKKRIALSDEALEMMEKRNA